MGSAKTPDMNTDLNVSNGLIATEIGRPPYVRSAPDSDRTTDIREVRKVPGTEVAQLRSIKEKAARRRPFNSNLIIVDQPVIKVGCDFRRYAMKPMPAKPRIIMAHVEGSGTAATV